MRAIMIAGTSSWAGKSLLTAGFCAALRRRGLSVAPFKAQNMSNNARVVEGGEIGAAQYFQALAAGVVPTTDHNPVLLKPERATASQVVVNGVVDWELTAMAWRERAPYLKGAILAAYDRVATSADVVVIEGAGSPAEINLADVDMVNLGIARYAQPAMAIVCDIDRGGAFAHLYGTHALLPSDVQTLVKGFILNRFRGDVGLLAPGPEQLETLTGVPTIGVVPMVDHGLPDEDGVDTRAPSVGGLRVRIVRGPAASNLDEWSQLRHACDVVWAMAPGDLDTAELIILPGSKMVAADLAWMRRTGMDEALRQAHRRGTRVLAVCGGIQVLGGVVSDPHGVEQSAEGLGILPSTTVFGPSKRTRMTTATFSFALEEPWAALRGVEVRGYEIRFGETSASPGVMEVMADGLALSAGSVLGVYLHGLAEDPQFIEALCGRPPRQTLSDVLVGLGELVEEHVDVDRLVNA